MSELKWKPGQAVELSVLDNGAASAGQARILEVSGKRMRLASELAVAGAAAVRLDWDGQLLLGQVLETGPGEFWIEIQHMLLDTAGLRWQGWRG
ncbi:MAG TPA: hypothetical protein VLW65_20340 [Bryobacteraceae bacterium]|nr:hypothetical protein [Bryobacteraceae bacterium]